MELKSNRKGLLMRINLQVRHEHKQQLERDKNSLLSSNILLPITCLFAIESKDQLENEDKGDLARAYWVKADQGLIRFYSGYFNESDLKKRLVIFLHEVIHLYLFFTEPRLKEWENKANRLVQERTKEGLDLRYRLPMTDWVLQFPYVNILKLPLEFFAEDFFARKYSHIFQTRIKVCYYLRNKKLSSLEQWREKHDFEGSEVVFKYEIYIELLKIRHFLKLIGSNDHYNQRRFRKLYKEVKDRLNAVCINEDRNYFEEMERKLINVCLEPLYFPENDFLNLSIKLWDLCRMES